MTPDITRAIITALSLMQEANKLLAAACVDLQSDLDNLPESESGEETLAQAELSTSIAYLEDALTDLENAISNATTAQESPT